MKCPADHSVVSQIIGISVKGQCVRSICGGIGKSGSLLTARECTMTNDKTHIAKKDVTATVMLCVVLCIIAITVKLLLPTPNADAYCDRILKKTGLDFSQMYFCVEHKFCEDKWIDAHVYFKLKVKGSDTSKIINRLRGFRQYEGQMDLYSPPLAWWKPGPSAIKIAYIKDDDGYGTVIIIAYVEPPDNGAFTLYIRVIPV